MPVGEDLEREDPDLLLVDLDPLPPELDDLLWGLFDGEDDHRIEELMVNRYWTALPPETRDFLTQEMAAED